jgi:hypothetical protein
MRSSSARFVVVAVFMLLGSLSAGAAQIDMKDPRRAVGREDDIRVDAQVLQHEVSSSSPLNVTYQIQNLTAAPIAVADKVSATDYDPETSTIVFSIGAEIPDGKTMPHLVVIRPGEKRAFSTGCHVHVVAPAARTPWTAVPRFVQVKVVVLRDLTPFAGLIEKQLGTSIQPPLPDALFDPWVESSDSVLLNPVPVRWSSAPSRGAPGADATSPAPLADAGGGGR